MSQHQINLIQQIRRRGIYTNGVLKTLQDNFRTRIESCSFSKNDSDVLRELKYLLASYEILIVETSQDFARTEVHEFGNSLSKLFYQMIEIVRYLVNSKFQYEPYAHPPIKEDKEVEKTSEHLNRRETFAELERARFLLKSADLAFNELNLTNKELDDELMKQLNNREEVLNIDQSNAQGILLEAVALLQSQHERASSILSHVETTRLKTMRPSELEQFLKEEILKKEELMRLGKMRFHEIYKRLLNAFPEKSAFISKIQDQASQTLNVEFCVKPQQLIKLDLQKKRMYRKIEEDNEILRENMKMIAELQAEKKVAVKKISRLEDELSLKQLAFLNASYQLNKTENELDSFGIAFPGQPETKLQKVLQNPLTKKIYGKSSKVLKKTLIALPNIQIVSQVVSVSILTTPNQTPQNTVILSDSKSKRQNLRISSNIKLVSEGHKISKSYQSQQSCTVQMLSEIYPCHHKAVQVDMGAIAAVPEENQDLECIPTCPDTNNNRQESQEKNVCLSNRVLDKDIKRYTNKPHPFLRRGAAANKGCSSLINLSDNRSTIKSSAPSDSIFKPNFSPVLTFHTPNSSIGVSEQISQILGFSVLHPKQHNQSKKTLRKVTEQCQQNNNFETFNGHVEFSTEDLETLFFGQGNAYNYELFYLNALKDANNRPSKPKSSHKYRTGVIFSKIESLDGNQSRLLWKLYKYLHRKSDINKKIKNFLRYPYSAVKYFDNPVWKIQTDTELEYAQLARLFGRISRLHSKCGTRGIFCKHVRLFLSKLGFKYSNS